jgi:hypothetical protein
MFQYLGGAYSLKKMLPKQSRYNKLTRDQLLTKIEDLMKYKNNDYTVDSGLKRKADKGYIAYVYRNLKKHVKTKYNAPVEENKDQRKGHMTSIIPFVQPVIQTVASLTQTPIDYPRGEPDEEPEMNDELYIERLFLDPKKEKLLIKAVQTVARNKKISSVFYENYIHYSNHTRLINFINKYNIPILEIKNIMNKYENIPIIQRSPIEEKEEKKENNILIPDKNEDIKQQVTIPLELSSTNLPYLTFWINGKEQYITSNNIDKYEKYNIKDMIKRIERNLLKIEKSKKKLKKEIKQIMVSTSDNKKHSLYDHIKNTNNIFLDDLIYSESQYNQDLYNNNFHIILQYMKIYDVADMYADLPLKIDPQSIINLYNSVKSTYTNVYEILNN